MAEDKDQLLTDIWHNQATIIKWLSKIEENQKRMIKLMEYM